MESYPKQTSDTPMDNHVALYGPWQPNPTPANYWEQLPQGFAGGHVQNQECYRPPPAHHHYHPYSSYLPQVYRDGQRGLSGRHGGAKLTLDVPTAQAHALANTSSSKVAEQMPPIHGRTVGNNLEVLCAVCGDFASGVHYCVYTCEGCKSFFWRMHLRQKPLFCRRGNLCTINKGSRRDCISCRYRSCLRAGMVVDEHVLKLRSKKHARLEGERKSHPYSDLTKTLVSAHRDIFITASKTHSMLRNGIQTPNKEFGVNGSLNAQQFVFKVPGIANLPQDTQQVVLTHAIPEIMLLQLASKFVPEQRGFVISEGHLLSLSVVIQVLGRPLTQRLVRLAVFFVYSSIDETELSLLCGLTVTLPDYLSAYSTDIEALEEMFRAHLHALREYEMEKRQSKPLTVGKIILRLIDLWIIAFNDCGQLIELYMEQTVCNGSSVHSLEKGYL